MPPSVRLHQTALHSRRDLLWVVTDHRIMPRQHRASGEGGGGDVGFQGSNLTMRNWWLRILAAAVLTLALPVIGAKEAGADGGVVSTYADPSISNPVSIVAGPDGALWFVNRGNNSIGRITTAGVVTNFTDTTIKYPTAITVGPDGALWFTNWGTWIVNQGYVGGSIGRITTAGVVSNYTDPTINSPGGITTGPDGALWFTNGADTYDPNVPSSIGRITTAGVVSNYTDPTIATPLDITAGPDGALWFTNLGPPALNRVGSIGRITTDGVVSNFTSRAIGEPNGITVGPDGALWFAQEGGIGRITPAGVVSAYSESGAHSPNSIVAGSDGALWFTDDESYPSSSIGRITTAGSFDPRFGYSNSAINLPGGITPGPDGAMWFTNQTPYLIERITTIAPYAVLSPNSGPPGTTVDVSGGGFKPDETVKVSYKTGLSAPSPTSVTLCSTTAGSDGSFSCDAVIPLPPTAGGGAAHNIVVKGKSSKATATATFTTLIVPATLTTNPSSGPPGTAVTLSGNGYNPGESVKVTYKTGLSAPDPASILMCDAMADATGMFTCNADIPVGAAAGPNGAHKIIAKGVTSLDKATTIFTVTAP